MKSDIKILIQEQKIGELDTHYIDQNGGKIATLLRNADGKTYVLFFYPDGLKQITFTGITSHMQASSMVEKTLVRCGYNVLNKKFTH
jgi:hypothetical protein